MANVLSAPQRPADWSSGAATHNMAAKPVLTKMAKLQPLSTYHMTTIESHLMIFQFYILENCPLLDCIRLQHEVGFGVLKDYG